MRAVRFIFNLTGKRRFLSITPFLEKLHFLPVYARIKFKLCLLVYKCVNGCAPQYLSDLLTEKILFSILRSANDYLLLDVKHVQSRYGQSSFSYAAPYHWNNLPLDIRSSSSVDSFKCALKTFLFSQHFESYD